MPKDDLISENEYLHRIIQTQEITNKLLQLSLEEPSLDKMLNMIIEHLVAAPILPLESKGAIFFVEKDEETLIMKAQKGLPDYLLSACATIPFGKCLCGKAAQNKEIVFAGCVDELHDISYDGMPPHGHYCLPVMRGAKLLGVITLYTEHGHTFKTKEYEFLQSITNVIAGIIVKKEAEEELKQAQIKLLQTGKLAAIGQLAAGIAHEINNPMSFIGSNLFILEKYIRTFQELFQKTDALITSINSADPSGIKHLANDISRLEEKTNLNYIANDISCIIEESKSGIDRINKIIENMQHLAAGQESSETEIDIEEILDSVLDITLNSFKYKVDIEKKYRHNSKITGNPQKLAQVFINIILNAAQSIDDKGIIKIKTYTEDKYNYITVTDTGCGIPEQNIDQIFNPFYTTKPAGQGTGLGLSLSYDIIKDMLGEIKVSSEVGKGSIFTIKIPRKQ